MPANGSSTRTFSSYTSFPPQTAPNMLSASPQLASPGSPQSRVPRPSRASKPSSTRSLLPSQPSLRSQPESSRQSTSGRPLSTTARALAVPPLHHSQFHLQISQFACPRPRVKLLDFLRRIYRDGEVPVECRSVYPVGNGYRILFRANPNRKESQTTLNELVIELYTRIFNSPPSDLELLTPLALDGFSIPEKADHKLLNAWAMLSATDSSLPSPTASVADSASLSDCDSLLVEAKELKGLAERTERLIRGELRKVARSKIEPMRSTATTPKSRNDLTGMGIGSGRNSIVHPRKSTSPCPISRIHRKDPTSTPSSSPRLVENIVTNSTLRTSKVPTTKSYPPRVKPASRGGTSRQPNHVASKITASQKPPPVPPKRISTAISMCAKKPKPIPAKKPSRLQLKNPSTTTKQLDIPPLPKFTLTVPNTPALAPLVLPSEDIEACEVEIHRIFYPSRNSTVPPTPTTKIMPTPLPSPPDTPPNQILIAEVQHSLATPKPGLFMPSLPKTVQTTLAAKADAGSPELPSPPLTIIDDTSSVYSDLQLQLPLSILPTESSLREVDGEDLLDLVQDIIEEMTREVELREVRVSLEEALHIDRRGSVASEHMQDCHQSDDLDAVLERLVREYGSDDERAPTVVERGSPVTEAIVPSRPSQSRTISGDTLQEFPRFEEELGHDLAVGAFFDETISTECTQTSLVIRGSETKRLSPDLYRFTSEGILPSPGSVTTELAQKSITVDHECNAASLPEDFEAIVSNSEIRRDACEFLSEFRAALLANDVALQHELASHSQSFLKEHHSALLSSILDVKTVVPPKDILHNSLSNVSASINAARITASFPMTPDHTIESLLQHINKSLVSLLLIASSEISESILAEQRNKPTMLKKGISLLGGVSAAASAALMFGARQLTLAPTPNPTPTTYFSSTATATPTSIVTSDFSGGGAVRPRHPAAFAVGVGMAAVGLSRMGSTKGASKSLRVGARKARRIIEEGVPFLTAIRGKVAVRDAGGSFDEIMEELNNLETWVDDIRRMGL